VKYYILFFKISFIVIIITFITCDRSTKEQIANRKIELNSTNSEQIKLSQIFSSADIFNLSTNDIVFERPKKILVKNNHFFMQSKTSIIICDEFGYLVLYLFRKGNGPGEYIGIADFHVEDNGNILINDTEGRKMIRYNFQGEYINTINHNLVSYNFIKLNDKIYLNSGKFVNPQSEYEVNVWDEDKNSIVERYMKQEKSLRYLSVLEYTNFSFFNDTLSYSQSFSNTIYQLEKNQTPPRLYINFGKNNLPKKYTERYTDLRSLMENFWSSEYASRIDGYREGRNFLFFAYSFQDKMPFFWLSKKGNDSYHFDKFEDDFLFPGVIQKTGYDFMPVFIDENYAYFSIDAYRFIELFDKIKTPMDGKWENQFLMEKTTEQIDEYSNALIIRYKIK